MCALLYTAYALIDGLAGRRTLARPVAKAVPLVQFNDGALDLLHKT